MNEYEASEDCIILVKSFEGVCDGNPATVNLDPYLCPASVATIGWGHAIFEHGKMLRGPLGLDRAQALYPDGITKAQAEELLREDIAVRAKMVRAMLTVPVTQKQFDALISFDFNLGEKNLHDSTLLKLLNSGQPRQAAGQFSRWNKSNGVELAGLTRRRAAEASMFLEGVA